MNDEKMNLNQAGIPELATLPGIGEKLAAKIVEYREERQPFSEVADLAAIPGISEQMVSEIGDRVTVGDVGGSEEKLESGTEVGVPEEEALPSPEAEVGSEMEETPVATAESEAEPDDELESEAIIILEPEAVETTLEEEPAGELNTMPQSRNVSTRTGFFPRLGGFLKRLLLAFIKLGLVFIAIAALAGIAWLIYKEIDRSFDSVTRRMDFNTERIELADSDIETLLAANDIAKEQVAALQTAVATQDAFIATLESDLVADQKQQDEVLSMLEENVTALIASTDAISRNVAFFDEGLVSLQQDATSNVSDIDAVGGQVDALQVDLVALNDEVEAVQTELGDYSADEFSRMRQALALFRVWEMVSRARLRLIEQNAGLAATDIDAALASVDSLLGAIPEEEETTTAGLEQVQQRLTLAASNLPDDQVAAARDLETAWEAIDAALAELFGQQSPRP